MPKGSQEVSLDTAAIKQAIAHFLSRRGSADFDPKNIALLFNHSTGEVTATALSRPTTMGR